MIKLGKSIESRYIRVRIGPALPRLAEVTQLGFTKKNNPSKKSNNKRDESHAHFKIITIWGTANCIRNRNTGLEIFIKVDSYFSTASIDNEIYVIDGIYLPDRHL